VRGKRVKDKRIFEERKRFRAEIELEGGEIVQVGVYDEMAEAQADLDCYARDVALYRNTPQSVFIRNPQ
jgi:hypothetical protein